jgi:F0F1-type ATP synthase assembly protein I
VEEEKKKQVNNWAPAIQIMTEVSTWIIGPIVIALIAGKALDSHFGTSPVIFLSLTGLAFLITCFGMYRVVKNYMKTIQPPKSPLSGGPESSSPDKGRTEERLNQK